MDAINYLTLGLSGKEQLGSTSKAKSNKSKDFNYKDGLSLKELQKIDKNGDGAVTESEFKKAFGSNNYKSYWNAYKEFYNASTTAQAKGNTSTQISADGTKKTTSYYNEKGKMTYYVVEQKTTTGKVTKVKYNIVDGKAVKVKTTTTSSDGTATSVNEKTKSTTKTAVDGTSTTRNADNQVTQFKSEDGKENYKISYDKNGKIKKVTINGSAYSNCSVKNNTTTIKDDKGNIVAKIYASKEGKTIISEYKNGKKSKSSTINKNGVATNISTYNSKGQKVSKQICGSDTLRVYNYSKKGQIESSADYKDGVIYSMQTYSKKKASDVYENETGSLWDTRTYFDKDGNVTGHVKYSYKKKGDNVVVTTDTYSADKKTKTGKTITEKDSYGNNLKKTKYNSNGEMISITKYTYDTDKIETRLSAKHLVSTTTESATGTTIKSYEDEKVVSKEVTKIVDGEAQSISYQYIYHSNGQILREDKTDNKTGETIITCYDDTGIKESERIEDSAGNRISFKMNLYNVVKNRYPELSETQIKELCEKCAEMNNISITDLIEFDYENQEYKINFPE